MKENMVIGKVIVGKEQEEYAVTLGDMKRKVVDENEQYLGVLAICVYRERPVLQYIPKAKLEELGLDDGYNLKPYTVEIKTGGRSGKGESMSLISYVVLKDTERGNKLLREYDYEKNRTLGIGIMKVTYQNSAVKLGWICEICGKEFEALLNNRVGHSQSDCDCFRSFYKTSTNEELVALMLKRSIPNLETQVPVFGDRRRVDMAFEIETGKFIVEYDGAFHDEDIDRERDKEAKALGYTTIRIAELNPNSLKMSRIDLVDKDVIIENKETGTYTLPLDYVRYGYFEAINYMIQTLKRCLGRLGVEIDILPVTKNLLKAAEENRKINKRKVAYIF